MSKNKFKNILNENVGKLVMSMDLGDCANFTPKLLNGSNYIDYRRESILSRITSKLKRTFGVLEVEENLGKIHKLVSKIHRELPKIEEKYKDELDQLLKRIILSNFTLPNEDKLSYNDTGIFEYESLLGGTSNFDYANIDEYNKHLSSINNRKINYAIICAASKKIMEQYRQYDAILDELDPNLMACYDKICAYNDFMLWHNENQQDISSARGFDILDNNGSYHYSIEGGNFLMKLHNTCKAILSVLLNEKYDNQYINYTSNEIYKFSDIISDKILGTHVMDDIKHMASVENLEEYIKYKLIENT